MATEDQHVTKGRRKRVLIDAINLVVPWTELHRTDPAVFPQHPSQEQTSLASSWDHAAQSLSAAGVWTVLTSSGKGTAQYLECCELKRLNTDVVRMPDASTVLKFPYRLEKHQRGIHWLATANAQLPKRL